MVTLLVTFLGTLVACLAAAAGPSEVRPDCLRTGHRTGPDWPPDWAALMALTSSAFFIEPAPEIPRPPAIAFRSAISIELSPPPRFFGADVPASGAVVVESRVSVT